MEGRDFDLSKLLHFYHSSPYPRAFACGGAIDKCLNFQICPWRLIGRGRVARRLATLDAHSASRGRAGVGARA
jgi:hypothetical protein